MSKLNTINVVEVLDGRVIALWSFNNDTEGVINAQQLFEQVASENGFSQEEIEDGEGTCENLDGYSVTLVTSDIRMSD